MGTPDWQVLTAEVSPPPAPDSSSKQPEVSTVPRINAAILSALVVLGIGIIAYADRQVESLSLGFLYVLPLALSALIHRRYTALSLAAVCVVLHDLYAPVQAHPQVRFAFAAMMALTYVGVVIVVGRLADQKEAVVRLTEQQRNDLLTEMELAAEVQRLVLPRTRAHPGVSMAMLPARIVAGDYYDILELEGGDVGLVIADVSGKGVAAGLLMPSLQVALRMAVAGGAPAREFMRDFNKFMYGIMQGERYISLFYARLSTSSGQLDYTNAGHNPPLLIRKDGTVRLLDRGGLVLGVLPGGDYEQEQLMVETGDVLVLYTDGIVECENPKGEPFSTARLVKVAAGTRHLAAEEMVAKIFADVLSFACADECQDDATVLVAKLSPQNEAGAEI
jgi:serine phosphatase RsbU (regulator of sigma subunit)